MPERELYRFKKKGSRFGKTDRRVSDFWILTYQLHFFTETIMKFVVGHPDGTIGNQSYPGPIL